MESILTSIKKLLGISEEYKQFDTDIIIHINSVFMTLLQLGVGPSDGFTITDEFALWRDFIEDHNKLHAVKTYMYLKVKLLFDPGSLGSATLAAYERQIAELEWRLNMMVEAGYFVPEIDIKTIADAVNSYLDENPVAAPDEQVQTAVDNYMDRNPARVIANAEVKNGVLKVT